MKEFKRFSVWLIALMAITATTATLQAADYDFKVDQLYYKISGTAVTVVSENASHPRYNAGNKPTGNLTIPADVTHEGTTYSVTAIGEAAFFDCSGLTSVSIPAGVTSIGKLAFTYCSGLTSVSIPASVTTIGNAPFAGCTALTAITVEAGNPNYASADGVLYNKAKTELIQCPGGKTGAVSIPASVTTIGYAAFFDCSGLTSVSIPAGVTTIGDYAFANCSGLTSVTIPAGVTTIGERAFGGCFGLTDITVGWITADDIPAINPNVFNGLTPGNIKLHVPPGTAAAYQAKAVWKDFNMEAANKEFTDGTLFYIISGTAVKVVPENASNPLYNADNEPMGVLTIPAGVTHGGKTYQVTAIGGYAFFGCSGLTSVSIPASVTTIGKFAFGNCSGLTSVTIPTGVTTIGEFAFWGCTGLTSVTIPASVTTIGKGAFYGCTALTAITVDAGNPNYASADGVLYNKAQTELIKCPASKTGAVSIPASVTTIGESAFSGCTGLTSVTIPAGVTSIGESAFWGCTGLTDITVGWTTAPDIPAINSGVFSPFGGLTPGSVKLHVPPGTAAAYRTKAVWKDFNIVEPAPPALSVTPASLTMAAAGEMKTLTVTSNTGWTVASDQPWLTVSPASGTNDGTVNVTAAAHTETTPRTATVTITDGGSLTHTVTVTQDGTSLYDFKVGLLFYKISGTAVTVVPENASYPFYNPGNEPTGVLTIPADVIHGGMTYPVTAIGERAFASCSALTSVSIPAEVTTIGKEAFGNCTGLKTVTVHWKTPLAITPNVFYGVTLSGITLNVPAGKIKAYQAANVWKNFGTIMTVANETVDGLRVYAADGALHLTLPAAETVRIYNLSGSLVKTLALTAGNHVLPLPDGFYLVSIGTQVRKVMVK